jgi:hypothetical protein
MARYNKLYTCCPESYIVETDFVTRYLIHRLGNGSFLIWFQGFQTLGWESWICPPNIWHPFMEMAGKQFSRLWKRLCNHVLQLVQLGLTIYVTASYGLWKWLANSSPVYGNGCATMSYSLYN